jgi:hypothetical protein
MLALMRFESSEFKKAVKKLQRLGRDLGSKKLSIRTCKKAPRQGISNISSYITALVVVRFETTTNAVM